MKKNTTENSIENYFDYIKHVLDILLSNPSNMELEDLRVELYNTLIILKSNLKSAISLESKLDDEYHEYKKLYKDANSSHSEVIKSLYGEGEYCDALQYQADIKRELDNLRSLAEKYGEDRQKEYDLKKGPLTEDLESATEYVNLIKDRFDEIEENYHKLSNIYLTKKACYNAAKKSTNKLSKQLKYTDKYVHFISKKQDKKIS